MIYQWEDFVTKPSSLGHVYSLMMTSSLALGGHHHTNLNFTKPESYMPLTWFSWDLQQFITLGSLLTRITVIGGGRTFRRCGLMVMIRWLLWLASEGILVERSLVPMLLKKQTWPLNLHAFCLTVIPMLSSPIVAHLASLQLNQGQHLLFKHTLL